ncbi:MAG: hypothetical protein U0998_06125 [Moraxellaceae bacterium]|nr:hypothetical protein [Moraxellaceae bacterium]MDZ4386780.1 hypothetical protein [Moraxellaceae bacterium]
MFILESLGGVLVIVLIIALAKRFNIKPIKEKEHNKCLIGLDLDLSNMSDHKIV